MDKIKQTIADTFLELAEGLETGRFGGGATVALMGVGSEHGEETTMRAALNAAAKGIKVIFIGETEAPEGSGVETIKATCQDEAFHIMEDLLKTGKADAAVTMHYPFPIGVSTVGLSIAPGTGKPFFLATTTGTSSTERVEGMILNTISGIATAKAYGIEKPTVGLLNLDGIRQVEIALNTLKKNGYDFEFSESARADGGAVMRGNDVLLGTPDIMVCDTLTGNVITKMLSAGYTGGHVETVGYGYGPGVGEGYDQIVHIVSRASGAPLIANAIEYAAKMVQGDLINKVHAEYHAAHAAGLKELLEERKAKASASAPAEEEVKVPEKEVATGEILGVDVLDLEDATKALWKLGIYAESGMGCTGPVIKVNEAKLENAHKSLVEAGYLSE
ncbi:MAG: glycine/sarcosine/betaine reductase complex component C subunit alpha [Eubacteriales bacterium]|nr:glycine/sarcosine/betaine reductase complex component C subunit alpha [Eubacteriales bacterium]